MSASVLISARERVGFSIVSVIRDFLSCADGRRSRRTVVTIY